MKICEVTNSREWNHYVLSSKYSSPTHFFNEADIHVKVDINNETYIATFRTVNFFGARFLLSYGTRMDGGMVPLNNFNYVNECIKVLMKYFKDKGYDVLNLTFKEYYMKDYVSEMVKILNNLSIYSVKTVSYTHLTLPTKA